MLQGLHFPPQGGLHFLIVLTKLHVELLPVWGCGHGSAEKGLDHKRVVWLESVSIGLAEGVSELLGDVVDVVAEGLDGEIKATVDSTINGG